MLLSEMLNAIEKKRVENFRDARIEGLSYDSREVGQGFAFFCVKGLVTDGHLYATEAIDAGAAALFAERELDEDVPGDVVTVEVPDTRTALALCSASFYGNPSGSLRVVGVTGTNGKTTTTYLLDNIARRSGIVPGLIGTVETRIGDEVETVTRTTPESLDLERLLSRMVDAGVDTVAMEVSSHALELERVTGCKFDVVVFTNLTQDHLDFHITLEEYFRAKQRLFQSEEFGGGRKAIVNADDDFGLEILKSTKLESLSFGIESEADIRARSLEVSATGNRFTIEYPGGRMDLETALQGRFNVYNCLAATGSAYCLGIDEKDIAEGLMTLKGVPGRFESIDCGQQFSVIVDYAHTPDGVRNLLEACREVTDGRVIAVVGCGGDRDRDKRPIMGRVSVEMSDVCIITSDNPRSEDPEEIIEMILEEVEGAFDTSRYQTMVDRRSAIYGAIEEAEPGDLVVIAGKGHESGQIFADRVIPFDDREVARKALEEVAGAQY